jgi:hypothetical protein
MSNRPTLETDAMASMLRTHQEWCAHSARLERQRNELMEVCQRLVELDLSGTDDSIVRFIVSAYQNNAKAAIASAKGGEG